MLEFSDIERLTQGFALALPLAALVTLALLLRFSAKRERKRDLRGAELSNAAAPGANFDDEQKVAHPMTLHDSTLEVAEPAAATASIVAAAPNAAAAAADRIAALESRIEATPPAALASVYLQLAAAHGELGDENSRMAALRSAAGVAAQHRALAEHAEARLQLGEAAFVAGDLTGACEQWQMARAALLESGQTEAYTRIDKRMRDNGCPTDWVLTDF